MGPNRVLNTKNGYVLPLGPETKFYAPTNWSYTFMSLDGKQNCSNW